MTREEAIKAGRLSCDTCIHQPSSAHLEPCYSCLTSDWNNLETNRPNWEDATVPFETGIYYRVERDGKWQSIDLADMTADEIRKTVGEDCPKLIVFLCFRLREMVENSERK